MATLLGPLPPLSWLNIALWYTVGSSLTLVTHNRQIAIGNFSFEKILDNPIVLTSISKCTRESAHHVSKQKKKKNQRRISASSQSENVVDSRVGHFIKR